MLNKLPIKHKIYVACGAMVLAILFSSFLNKRLIAEFSENAQHTTDLIESLSLDSQSIQAHVYQARLALSKTFEDPAEANIDKSQ